MELKFQFAEHSLIQFKLNFESKYYELQLAPPGFKELPNELLFEQTQREDKISAPFILRGRISGGKYLFFTGLRTAHNRIFYGDKFKNPKSKSLLFVVLSRDNSLMDIYYFNNYYPHNPTQRERNIQSFIELFQTD